jgi:hypothetical protein
VPVTGLAGSTATELRYTMVVPAGATSLTFTIAGGAGDADLYVRFGSAPTTSTWCRPYLTGNNETCVRESPGRHHVMVRGAGRSRSQPDRKLLSRPIERLLRPHRRRAAGRGRARAARRDPSRDKTGSQPMLW